MKDNNRKDARTNSPFRHKVEMEAGSFSYDDHIANYLERQKAKGQYAYNNANQKVQSSYGDTLQGKPYGIRNPEPIEGLDSQGYDNPFERQYQINKRKSEGITATANSSKTSSHFDESKWQKVSGWTEQLTDSVKRGADKGLNSFFNAAGTYLGAKVGTYTYKKLLALTTGAGLLGIGLYSSRTASEEE